MDDTSSCLHSFFCATFMAKLTTNLRAVENFLNEFRPHFSAKQFNMFSDSVLSLFFEYKRCSLEPMAQNIKCPYQNLQYFVSESKWDTLKQLNQTRLNNLMNHSATKPTKKGVMAIDDTGNPKPYAKKTEGAFYQHCGPLDREEVCHVVVTSAYVDVGKHFAAHFAPYLPQRAFADGELDPRFQSKIQIAMEFIRQIAADPRLPQHAVKLAASLGVLVTGDLKCNRNILFDRPDTRQKEYVQQDELVTLIRAHYSHKVSYVERRIRGENKKIPVYSFVSTLKDCKTPVKIVVVLGELFEKDDKKIRILFSTDTKASAQQIVDVYALRWGIERNYAELKDLFSFDQYQLAKLAHIERYWFLTITAWSLAYRLKMLGALKKITARPLETFPDHIRAVRDLLHYQADAKLPKNETDRGKAFYIVSKRALRKAG